MSTGRHADSTGKLLEYFDAMDATKHDLFVSPTLARSFACPPACGACCLRFTLDWFDGPRLDQLRTEYPDAAAQLEQRTVTHNGVTRTVHTIKQDPKSGHHCGMLNGFWCGIHTANPLTCNIEPIKFKVDSKRERVIVQRKDFGRAWAMTRIDGTKGTRCPEGFGPASRAQLDHDITLFRELADVADAFNMTTHFRTLAAWIKNHGPRVFTNPPASPILVRKAHA